MRIFKSYSLDDLLLKPKYSEIQHRGDVSTKVDLGRGIVLDIPIISANMKFVSGITMAKAISDLGGMALLHRFSNNRLKDYQDACNIGWNNSVPAGKSNIGISIGTNQHEIDFFRNSLEVIKDWGVKIICVDVAHGHHINTKNMIQYIRNELPEILIIAGNVATGEGAVYLAEAGADVIKIGIGPSSVCTTRVETAAGYGQLSAIDNCRTSLDDYRFQNVKLIADGGIKNSGDCVKCLTIADAVMLGNLLAGTDEAPGDIIIINGHKYKQYAGSSTHKSTNVEGVSGYVPYRGPVKNVISHL
jgi:IMP dehydrogenase